MDTARKQSGGAETREAKLVSTFDGKRAVSWAQGLAVAALLGAPAQASAHTTNICWLVHGNGDVQFFAGTYHDPSEGLSGGVTVDGTRYTFTESFGGNIDDIGLTNCQGGFNQDGTIVKDPCGASQVTLHWQTVRVPGIATGDYSLSISGDSPVETPWTGCYPVDTTIDVDNPCAAFGDDDGDNICNPQDRCPDDPAKGNPGVCGCGVADDDADDDGTPDCDDACPNDAPKTEPGTCGCGVADDDTDGDETLDCDDGCPEDAAKTEPGTCGCGVADDDTDGDETLDCNDGCLEDAAKTEPGACGCGIADDDADADGTPDCVDECPADVNKLAPGICGCGVSDVDTDLDGVADCHDLCLGNDATGDADGDGFCTDIDHRALVISEDFSGMQGPCNEGGSVITVGIDEDNDGQLAEAEVKKTSYVCNGTTGTDGAGGNDGADGAGGLSTLVTTTKVGPDATCPIGGLRIAVGIDADGDKVLSDAEVQHTNQLCDATLVLFETEQLADKGKECPHGGLRVRMGHDDGQPGGVAGDGKLAPEEVESEQTVCLAPTDVLIRGGSSGCSAAGPGSAGMSWFSSFWLLALSALQFHRRRRQST